jgi:anti-anti-sigma factor
MPVRARVQTWCPYAPAVAAYDLELHETTVGGFAVAEVFGELDLTNADDLERRLESIAGDAPGLAPGLVIDLNKVTFVDSAALHVLFRLGRQLEDAGKSYGVVLAPSAPVSKTVEMVHLEEAARIAPTVDEMLGRLRSS